jgi:hypothetical protein
LAEILPVFGIFEVSIDGWNAVGDGSKLAKYAK